MGRHSKEPRVRAVVTSFSMVAEHEWSVKWYIDGRYMLVSRFDTWEQAIEFVNRTLPNATEIYEDTGLPNTMNFINLCKDHFHASIALRKKRRQPRRRSYF